jgi:hypothetical protein
MGGRGKHGRTHGRVGIRARISGVDSEDVYGVA